MSKRTPRLLLDDMLEAIEKIENYISNFNKEKFVSDEKTIDAVVRNLEIIGEAANRLPQNFTSQQSSIQWEKIIGLRHRIVHDYFGIDVEIIWSILEKDLPFLKKNLSALTV